MDMKKFLLYQLSAAQAQVATLQDLIAECGDAPAANPTHQEAEVKDPQPVSEVKAENKTANKNKSKKANTPAPEAAPALEENVDVDDFLGADSDTGPSIEDVRKAVKDFASKHGRDKALKFLSKFKCDAIQDLKKADYPKVLELVKKYT